MWWLSGQVHWAAPDWRQSGVQIRLPPLSPEWGQEAWLCITNTNLRVGGISAWVKNNFFKNLLRGTSHPKILRVFSCHPSGDWGRWNCFSTSPSGLTNWATPLGLKFKVNFRIGFLFNFHETLDFTLLDLNSRLLIFLKLSFRGLQFQEVPCSLFSKLSL
jgi:hypothetical protein